MAWKPKLCRCEELAVALEALIERYLGDAGDETPELERGQRLVAQFKSESP